MKYLAARMASYLGRELQLEADRVEVMQFALEGLLSTGLFVASLLATSALLGMWQEAVVAMCAAGVLRLVTGGAHMGSPGRCTLSGIVFFLCVGSLASLSVSFPFIVALAIGAVGLAAVYRWAPAVGPEKPITPRQARRLRGIGMVLSVCMPLLFVWVWHTQPALLWASFLGYAWQVVSLSPLVRAEMARADAWLARNLARLRTMGRTAG